MTSSTLASAHSNLLIENDSQSLGGSSTLPDDAQIGQDTKPAWISEITDHLNEFLHLPPNWDSFGATKIQLENIDTTIDVLLNFSTSKTPKPIVVPTNTGGVQIEWHERGIDLEVEIRNPLAIDVCFEDQTKGVEQEYELRSDLHILETLISELSSRRQ